MSGPASRPRYTKAAPIPLPPSITSCVADRALIPGLTVVPARRRSAFYNAVVRPRVLDYFAAELETTEDFFYVAGVRTFALGVTSATVGYSLWNRQHVDDDLGLTILVAMGTPHAGGEFAHGMMGYAHAVRAGAILIVNPLQPHSTAEFLYRQGNDSRRMVAFLSSRR